MDKLELQNRTKQFALRIVRLYSALPKGSAEYVLGKQLLRCGTSVGANYRAACLAKSRADFSAKLKICEEEADECIYWLELICMADLLPESRLQLLMDEARQIAAIMAAACKTTREAS